ncbi:hypothetical protein [Nitrincola schmidtii]|uniref:hypothetical protein n=1 Tax=Nitrincola schmidtii TaxID=1730894 RepID=UPI00124ECB84|nr:hypothetical protein [Nitrincola schmidtii]
MKTSCLKDLLKLTISLYSLNKAIGERVLDDYELDSLVEEDKNELIVTRVIINELKSAVEMDIEAVHSKMKLYCIQLINALTHKAVREGKEQYCYRSINPVYMLISLIIQQILEQNRATKEKLPDTVIERPPLALGYDINTPPAAPPISI